MIDKVDIMQSKWTFIHSQVSFYISCKVLFYISKFVFCCCMWCQWTRLLAEILVWVGMNVLQLPFCTVEAMGDKFLLLIKIFKQFNLLVINMHSNSFLLFILLLASILLLSFFFCAKLVRHYCF